ncbi:MAG: helicase-associated domain-containing protein [Xanthomonadales bacterium]|nr:helicase-associated domain-containing protein [Xanthomonadales bacterium]
MKRYDPDGRIPTLEVALTEHMNVDQLKKLAKHTNQKIPTRKADIAAVVERYLDGDRLKSVWQSLDELQRAAVAEVVHSSSTRFLADRFAAKYGRSPNWGITNKYGYRRNPSLLAFFFYGGGVMPDELKARLKTFVPKPAAAKVKTLAELPAACELPWSRWNPKTRTNEKGTEEVPLTVHQTELTAQRELLSVLRLIDFGKVAVSNKTRRPSAATIKAISNVLEGGDYYPVLPVKNKWHDENAGPIRAFAWPLIVQAGGMAQLSGSKLQLTKAGRKALSEPAAESLYTLWSKWIDTTVLDELSRIECVKGQTGKGKRGLTALSSRRDAIADTLAECPTGAWISTDEFHRFVCASGNDFTVSRHAWDLYICEKRYGSLGYEGGEQILDERYLLAFLLEYVATLGMIDVALIPPAGARYDYGGLWGTDELVYFSRYDGLRYFRITALGAYCLGSETGYQPAPVETKPVLSVLPNLEITAIGAELDQGDRIALDTYATQVSDLVWRLDRLKLLAAVEEGRSIAEVHEFLSARSSVAIPDTVTRLLDDVTERSTKVQDQGLVRLVECADPALAALIANDSRTRRHCMLAGERHLVVPASSETAFKRTLRELGYMVALGDVKTAKPRRKGSARKSASQSVGA